MKPWCILTLKRAVLRRQAYTYTVDSPIVVPATDLETALYPEDSATILLSPVTNTICLGTWEESCTPMHHVTGIRTSVPAIDPKVAYEPVPAPLS